MRREQSPRNSAIVSLLPLLLKNVNPNEPSAAATHARLSAGQTRHPTGKFVGPSSHPRKISVCRLATSNNYSQCPSALEKRTGFGTAGEPPTTAPCGQQKKTPTTLHSARAPPAVSKHIITIYLLSKSKNACSCGAGQSSLPTKTASPRHFEVTNFVEAKQIVWRQEPPA